MHLAVCDDNIADRKQMERLLGRESDRRSSTTGVLYVDSYGNKEAILTTPMIYDGIFMDMTGEDCDAVEIANKLREAGNLLPIVFCCSSIDYRKAQNLPENSLFMDKPISPQKLSEMCDTLFSIKGTQARRVEYRTDTETFYLEEADIMYAYPKDRIVHVHRTDGTDVEPVANMLNFCSTTGFDVDDSIRGTMKFDLGYIRFTDSGMLAMIGCSAVVNPKYISRIGLFHLTMEDGRRIRISPSSRDVLRRAAAAAKAG